MCNSEGLQGTFLMGGGVSILDVSIGMIPYLGTFWYLLTHTPECSPSCQAISSPLEKYQCTSLPGHYHRSIASFHYFELHPNCVSHWLFFPTTKSYDDANHNPLI